MERQIGILMMKQQYRIIIYTYKASLELKFEVHLQKARLLVSEQLSLQEKQLFKQ